MKTKIMIKALGSGLVLLFLMMVSASGYSQACSGNKGAVSIQNLVTSSNSIKFDLYYQNSGTTTYKLQAYNGNVRFTGLPLDGVMTIESQPSANAPFSTMPDLVPAYLAASQQLKWTETIPTPNTDPRLVVMAPGQPAKFCTIKYTFPTAVTQPTNGTIYLPIAITGGVQIQTASVYCSPNGGTTFNASQVAMTVGNALLTVSNPPTSAMSFTLTPDVTCATSGSVTSTTPASCFGSTGSATLTLAPVPTNTAVSYTVDGGSATSGVLSAGALTISGLSVGSHTVVITNTGCANPITVSNVSISGPSVPATNSTTVDACGSYSWAVNGATYTDSGVYTATNNSGACPVEETLNLTIHQNTVSSSSVTACESYTWAATGATYNASGDYTKVTTNPGTGGCTNTETLHLTINHNTTSDVTVSACQSYTWAANGTQYLASGDYTNVTSTPGTGGCTNTETLHLTINQNTTSESTIVACGSYTWAANGTNYTVGGDYTATTTNPGTGGCTNTATLHLTINNNTTSSSTVVACGSYTWAANNQTYTIGGDYTAVTPNPGTGGCTNTETLHLTINNNTTTSSTVVACGSYTWAANGATYSASGDYTNVTPNPGTGGCTNTETLHLTINQNTTSSSTIFACGSYVWPVNGQTYSATGDYTAVTTNPGTGGCTNTATLHLTVGQPSTSSETVATCTSYLWPVTGQTYTSTGTYTGTTTNASGCPNTVTLNLTINTGTLYFIDMDGDGFDSGAPRVLSCTQNAGYVLTTNGADCNDNDAQINPNHVEVLTTAYDDNCDAIANETFPLSYVINAQCGTTLSYIGGNVFAYERTAATGYRFEVTNGSNVRTIDTATNSFTLTSLSGGAAYGTTYGIRVSTKVDGFWRAYGPSCNITTPATPATTNIVTSQCGMTVSSTSTSIFANQVTAASQYRFEISGGSQATRTYDSPVNRFALYNFQGGIVYGNTYSIRVALMINGVWYDYGTPCNITAPAAPPVTSLVTSQCGSTITNSWQSIFCNQVGDAQGYRFEVSTTSPATSRLVDKPVNRFNLYDLQGGFATNTVYTVRVAILYNGVYQAFGPSCTITTAAALTKQATTDTSVFAVKAYPNPYADTFRLAMDSSSEDKVEVKVYDMIGKLIETRQVNASELASQEVGSRYPSGVYNIIVTQGENVKTLRVIKR